MSDEASEPTPEEPKRGREKRTFPATSFEEALEIAKAMVKMAGRRPVRRVTLFDQLGRSPESGPSRQLITNSAKYGLTKGSYQAETLELTPDGAIASDPDSPPREKARARVKLAVLNIPVFKSLYEAFAGNKLPAKAVLTDAAKEFGLSAELAEEAVDTFIVNLRYVGLLKTLSGADRIISLDHLLDTLPGTVPEAETLEDPSAGGGPAAAAASAAAISGDEFEHICFYVTPIGEDGTEQRKHSDLFLGSLVEPALEPFKLRVVRADKIDKPGLITRQILDYIVKARLVVADLSFANPNVFYELAVRHVLRLPTVQIIRRQDRIPFDVGQARTIQIDSSDIYSLVPKLEAYRAEIASQVRRALEDPDASDNPISVFYPNLRAKGA